jgi:hypothetical protein
VLELPRLELAAALLTGAAAITLIPHRRNLIGATVESVVWVAFVLASGLCIATFGDPRIQEATASVAWGALALARIQVAFVMDIVGAWTVAHRFMIANWVAIAAGADVLVLVFIRTTRAARQSAPRAHLGEWFELPRRVVRPAVVPAADPLAAIDRRLAAAAHLELQSMKGKVQTSPALARAAAATAHLLGPGHLRLRMVKLAIGIRLRREVLAHAAAAPVSVQIMGRPIARSPQVTAKRSRNSVRHNASRRKAKARRSTIPMQTASLGRRGTAAGVTKKA